MTPFFFGAGQRRLFGIFQPAATADVAQRMAVLCQPLGCEYLHAHRSMRQLALKLSAAGFHTLRFDYFGTGDSAGEWQDTDLEGWQADIETAIDELREMTRASHVALVGLRLGATLAAKVAARRAESVDALVLWDPVVSGDDYLKRLQSRYSHDRKRPVSADLIGFPIADVLQRELTATDLTRTIPKLRMRTLIVVAETSPSHESLRQAVRQYDGGPIGIAEIESSLPWIADSTETGAMPVDLIHKIVTFLS
jgi:pimeloyl-ACP methyl ester carboxylesterase